MQKLKGLSKMLIGGIICGLMGVSLSLFVIIPKFLLELNPVEQVWKKVTVVFLGLFFALIAVLLIFRASEFIANVIGIDLSTREARPRKKKKWSGRWMDGGP